MSATRTVNLNLCGFYGRCLEVGALRRAYSSDTRRPCRLDDLRHSRPPA